MHTLHDFTAWAGSQRKAAHYAGVHESSFSRILSGRAALTVAVAKRIERATDGRYLAADLLGLTRPDSEAA